MHKTSMAVVSRTLVKLSLVAVLFVAIMETSTLELGLFLGGHVGVSRTLLRVGILSLNAVCVSVLFVVPATWLFRVVDRRVAAPGASAMTQSSGFRWFIFAAGSVCLPFAEYMGYVYLSHWPHEWFSGASDLAAFTLAILTSFVCVWLIPIRWYWRLVVSVLVVPTIGFALIAYSLYVLCMTFRECL